MKLINWTPRPVSFFDDVDKMVKMVFMKNQNFQIFLEAVKKNNGYKS